LLAYFTVKKLIMDPYEQRKKEKERRKKMQANRAK